MSLGHDMRAVLIALELTSTARTAQLDPAGGEGTGLPIRLDRKGNPLPDGGPDAGDAAPHDVWRREWLRALNDEERQAAYDGAKAELDRLRKSDPPKRLRPETEDQLHARIVDRGEGWSTRDVANDMKCTEKTVRRARLLAGRDPKWGLLPPELEDREARDRYIARLAADGVTGTEISVLLSVSYDTVRRALGRR